MKSAVSICCAVAVALAAAAPASTGADELPLSGVKAPPGWSQSGKARRYTGKNLYGHIDGGAELFLELGFQELLIQKYRTGKAELTVEAYRMDSPESALAIYLAKCGKETPVPKLAARNTGDRYQLMLVRGAYFLLVNNFKGDEKLLAAMRKLADSIIKPIAPGQPEKLLKVLPAEKRVSGSEVIIRGPTSLQSLGTLGEGDILQLKGKLYGVAADYQDAAGDTFTLVIVTYPDAAAAQSAYRHLSKHLDATLKIERQEKDYFVFRNTKGQRQRAELQGKLLKLTLRLR